MAFVTCLSGWLRRTLWVVRGGAAPEGRRARRQGRTTTRSGYPSQPDRHAWSLLGIRVNFYHFLLVEGMVPEKGFAAILYQPFVFKIFIIQVSVSRKVYLSGH